MMANLEDQMKDLKEMNNELVQEVQYWKVTAAQHEKEKLDLMKEINELRLKISRLRSGGAAEARKLDTALQSSSEEALSHLVQASGAVARSMELVKQYILDRQELDTHSPRWSSLGNTPNNDKVHRVPPTLMGGQSIQPVVALSRTMLNSAARSTRSPNSVTQRAFPLRMLQDVYIPLTRIDMSDMQASMETEGTNDNSAEDIALDDSAEQLDDSLNDDSADDFDRSRRLDAVIEDIEPDLDINPDIDDDDDAIETPPRFRETIIDNPLEGPSWLLDVPRRQTRPENKEFLEADSTTPTTGEETSTRTDNEREEAITTPRAFTPTVRRRKRVASPHHPTPHNDTTPPGAEVPPPAVTKSRGDGKTNRILKVVVAKMRLSEEGASPPKRGRDDVRFDAPSPNGTTTAGLIVSENNAMHDNVTMRATSRASRISVDSRPHDSRIQDTTHDDSNTHDSHRDSRIQDRTHDDSKVQDRTPIDRVERTQSKSRVQNGAHGDSGTNRHDSHEGHNESRSHSETRADSRQSESDGEPHEGRTRRTRKNIIYKEKPLNRTSAPRFRTSLRKLRR